MTKLRDGYAPGMVDTFLDKVIHTLTRLEAGEITGIGGAPLLAPTDIRRQRFPVTKFRDGYEMSEVDDFLDEIVQTLNEYVERAARGKLRPLQDTTPDSSATSVPASFETVTRAPSSSPATEKLASYDPLTTRRSVAVVPDSVDDAAAGSHPAPSDPPHPDGLTGGEFLRKLQSTRATMFGPARESLTFRGPDGRALSALDVERTDDGLIIHLG